MGLFDAVVKPIGNWMGSNWDTLATGAASVVGFAVGGPVGAALAGAVVGGATAAITGKDVGAAALMGGLGGALGGVGGVFARGGLSAARTTALSNFSVLGRPTLSNYVAGVQNPRLYTALVRNEIPHLLAGSLGAGIGAGLGYYQETIDFGSGPGGADGTGYGPIPVSPIGEDEAPEELPDIFMPDPTKPNWPQDLTFSAPMQQNYKTLPGLYSDTWKSFGKDPTETSLPEEIDLPGVIADPEKAGIPDYTQRVQSLEIRFEELRSSADQVAKAVERTVEYCDGGKRDIRSSVDALGKFAVVHPANAEGITAVLQSTANAGDQAQVFTFPQTYGVDQNLTEDAYAFAMIEGAYGGIESIMGTYAQKFAALADETEPPGDPDENRDPDTPTTPQTPGAPNIGAPTAPTIPSGPELQTPNVEPPKPIDLDDDTTGPGSESPADKASQAAQEQLEQLSRDAAAAAGANPAAAMQGTAGSGLESMMLPALMQAMMGSMAGANQPQTRMPDDMRRPRAPRAPQAPTTAPAPGTTPQTAPPAAPTPANTQPPATKVTAPPTTQGPTRTGKPPVGEDGNVVYTFPDGRTQEVSAVVAKALDAAFGDASKTDAKEAYANTKVTWTDEKDIGTRVDPAQLMTGDVGVWEGRTALLVVFGTETSGTLEAVVDGQLQPVAGPADMRDAEGEFGEFVGFFHPPGIEKTEDGPAAAAEEPAAPVPDQAISTAPA